MPFRAERVSAGLQEPSSVRTRYGTCFLGTLNLFRVGIVRESYRRIGRFLWHQTVSSPISNNPLGSEIESHKDFSLGVSLLGIPVREISRLEPHIVPSNIPIVYAVFEEHEFWLI